LPEGPEMLPPDNSCTGEAAREATRDWFCDGFKEWILDGKREAWQRKWAN
jgi:hypothetical protein